MSNKPYIIGVSGGSGSGKTSFMKSLKDTFTQDQVCFIYLDDYYFPRDQQKIDQSGKRNFDLPESIDIQKLVGDLEEILKGQTVVCQEYTFNNPLNKPSSIELKPAPVIIIEGLFIYHYPELKSYFNLKLFIDATSELKLIRRIKRDQNERNYPIEDVLYRYEHHVIPSYNKYIYPYLKEVDVIINNNRSYKSALDLIKNHISSYLSPPKV